MANTKKTIFCIMGKSASGKTTLAKNLLEELKIENFKEIITTTSRPIRENEINGVHYHFKNKEYFEENKEIFCEINSYDTIYGEWFYGIEEKSILEADEFSLVVATPKGCSKLKTLPNVEIIPIYLYVSDEVRYGRLIKRGDNHNEILRRFVTDEEDFKNVLDLSPIVFYNYDYKQTLTDISNEIYYRILKNRLDKRKTND